MSQTTMFCQIDHVPSKLTGSNKAIPSHRLCTSSGTLEEKRVFGCRPAQDLSESPHRDFMRRSGSYPDESFRYIADGVNRSAGVEAQMGNRVGRSVAEAVLSMASRASATVGRISSLKVRG